MAAQGPRKLRVALACPGVGLVQRGFERLFQDLFATIRDDVDATMFKGGGPSIDGERRLNFIPRSSPWLRRLPVHKLFNRTPMHSEGLTFVLAMLPHLRGGAFDIVHSIDPPMTRFLYNLRGALGLDFQLLYTEGCAMPPKDYPPSDHIHHIAAVTLEEAARYGHAREKMTLIPCGVRPERFVPSVSRAEMRSRFGVPEENFVILSVAALNRYHKRTHYLIDEAARMGDRFTLWLDGSLDHGDPDLIDYAKARLGNRVVVSHVRSDEVGNLLGAADLFAHAATFEAFGIAIAEAAIAGLPVLTHNAPHFRWLVENEASLLDMTQEGALSTRIAAMADDPALLAAAAGRERALERFAWERLRAPYLDLYERVAAQTRSAAA